MAGDKKKEEKKFSRRDFVKGSGTAIAGGAFTVLATTTPVAAADDKGSYPLSTKYLVYDSRNCAGCYGCMIACSMSHDGEVSFSQSRIQMHRAVLNEYPTDITIHVCKQCPDPSCVKYCPTGACHVSAENGNIRMINAEKCIGCQTCIKMCPQTPHRTIWNPKANKSTKCDLCTNTPFFNKKGGVEGTQACVEACPKKVIKIVDKLPLETGGYDVLLVTPPKAKTGGFGGPGGGGPGGRGGGPGAGGPGAGGLGGPGGPGGPGAKPATPQQAPTTPKQ